MKTCGKCGLEHEKVNCPTCMKAASARYRERNRELLQQKARAYHAENKAADNDRARNYRAGNRERLNAKHAEYYAKNAERLKLQSAQWAKKNKEKRRTISKDWYARNRATVLSKQAARYELNKDKIRERNVRWRKSRPGIDRIFCQNRRAKVAAAGGKLSPGLAERLFELQRGRCACGCKKPLGDDYHLDHRMPLALGGTNTDDNIQLLRARCNSQKSAKHPVEFMQSRGFLL